MTSQFGPTLRRLRRDRMISQSSLADRAGFDHSYLSRLEASQREPSRDAVTRLSEAMTLSELENAMLFASAGYSAAGDLFRTDPELIALAEILWDDSLDAEHREKVRYVLRAIAELCNTPARPVMALVA